MLLTQIPFFIACLLVRLLSFSLVHSASRLATPQHSFTLLSCSSSLLPCHFLPCPSSCFAASAFCNSFYSAPHYSCALFYTIFPFSLVLLTLTRALNFTATNVFGSFRGASPSSSPIHYSRAARCTLRLPASATCLRPPLIHPTRRYTHFYSLSSHCMPYSPIRLAFPSTARLLSHHFAGTRVVQKSSAVVTFCLHSSMSFRQSMKHTVAQRGRMYTS